jgi:hypothetical protein
MGVGRAGCDGCAKDLARRSEQACHKLGHLRAVTIPLFGPPRRHVPLLACPAVLSLEMVDRHRDTLLDKPAVAHSLLCRGLRSFRSFSRRECPPNEIAVEMAGVCQGQETYGHTSDMVGRPCHSRGRKTMPQQRAKDLAAAASQQSDSTGPRFFFRGPVDARTRRAFSNLATFGTSPRQPRCSESQDGTRPFCPHLIYRWSISP